MRVVSENEGRRGLGVERASFCLCWWVDDRHVVVMHRTDGKTSASQKYTYNCICFFFWSGFGFSALRANEPAGPQKLYQKMKHKTKIIVFTPVAACGVREKKND